MDITITLDDWPHLLKCANELRVEMGKLAFTPEFTAELLAIVNAAPDEIAGVSDMLTAIEAYDNGAVVSRH